MDNHIERKVRINKIRKTILSIISGMGAFSASKAAPQIWKEYLRREKGRKWSKDSKYSFWRSVERMKKDGLIGNNFKLTDLGRKNLDMIEVLSPTSFGRWDGRWRMLIFDISEDRKYCREKIRNTLRQAGFMRLQDSIWIFPFDCEKLVTLLKTDLKVGKELLFVVAEEIEGDSRARDFFGV